MIRPELSPDGKKVVYIAPGPGTSNVVYVADLAARTSNAVIRADGKPMRLNHCGWSSSSRLVCQQYGLAKEINGRVQFVPYTRMFALDPDGKHVLPLGTPDSSKQLYSRQFDGQVLDWLSGADGAVLMTRYYVPQMTTGSLTAQTDEGYGVDLVDTRSYRSTKVEQPRLNVEYLSDGRGAVRLMVRHSVAGENVLNGKSAVLYRSPDSREWRELGAGVAGAGADSTDIEPLAVDSGANVAYVLRQLDGRRALYRIFLDGSLKTELVFAHPQVDIGGVVTIGRAGRVVGASYATDRPHVEYFDSTYRQFAADLAPALPNLPLIDFVSADASEQVFLISASSDNDPGHFYIFDRNKRSLAELMPARPELARVKLSQVRQVQYPAADGTLVPAYLTLPPGVAKAEGLAAIVMPHGGPASRDVWGFDWLAQYYANRGFAVLQPNFRGSAGYGSDWFVKNGFRSWKVAIGDIVDGGRWLVSQGLADPRRLAVVGWSYGGYAALQVNVVDPDLFKAVVAVAPVTDLAMLKSEAEGFTSVRLMRDYIGAGPHIEEGSPARHADRFKAPVMLFHGDKDANVGVEESQAMDRALKRAGKQSELIVYPNLDHQLVDNAARADMLQRSYDFLATRLKLEQTSGDR